METVCRTACRVALSTVTGYSSLHISRILALDTISLPASSTTNCTKVQHYRLPREKQLHEELDQPVTSEKMENSFGTGSTTVVVWCTHPFSIKSANPSNCLGFLLEVRQTVGRAVVPEECVMSTAHPRQTLTSLSLSLVSSAHR